MNFIIIKFQRGNEFKNNYRISALLLLNNSLWMHWTEWELHLVFIIITAPGVHSLLNLQNTQSLQVVSICIVVVYHNSIWNLQISHLSETHIGRFDVIQTVVFVVEFAQ